MRSEFIHARWCCRSPRSECSLNGGCSGSCNCDAWHQPSRRDWQWWAGWGSVACAAASCVALFNGWAWALWALGGSTVLMFVTVTDVLRIQNIRKGDREL